MTIHGKGIMYKEETGRRKSIVVIAFSIALVSVAFHDNNTDEEVQKKESKFLNKYRCKRKKKKQILATMLTQPVILVWQKSKMNNYDQKSSVQLNKSEQLVYIINK